MQLQDILQARVSKLQEETHWHVGHQQRRLLAEFDLAAEAGVVALPHFRLPDIQQPRTSPMPNPATPARHGISINAGVRKLVELVSRIIR